MSQTEDVSEILTLLVNRVEDYAIYLLDPAGHVTTWNPGAHRIKGYAPEEIIGKHFSVFYLPDEKASGKPAKELEIAARDGKCEEEGWRVRKDGSLFWATILITPLFDGAGRIRAFAKITRDMTAHKEAEERLEAAVRDAQAANRLKDEFLTTLSHELRTPLTSILGWAALLKMGEVSPESHELAIQSIEDNARLQARLVDDLLDISRLEMGQVNVTFAPLDVALLVVQAVDAIRPTAEVKAIALTHQSSAERMFVSGDATRVRQICWNLLTNAVKFTDRGGTVHVRCFADGGSAGVEISDTGRGIEPSFLPRVFDRFSRGDSSFTHGAAGLGLGLSIARHLVEIHGGWIEAASPGVGAGSTFSFHLPILTKGRQAPAEMTEPPVTLPSLAGLSVLILEDDLHTRTFLRALVEQCGALGIPASSVGEALIEIRKRKPDAVISDIALPGEDGLVFIQKVRDLAPDVPVFAVTAIMAADGDRERLLRAGFDEYMRKPILPVELTERLRSLVAQKRALERLQ
ncbi:MAG: PAS domain-containing hybrid sensor histidine kinase/response regulator [Thermoanaerobaculia bacterium]